MDVEFNNLRSGFLKYKVEYESKVLEILNSGWYILGNEVSNFEKEFSKKIGSKYCVGVASGLDAIILGIRALGISKGDEVIVQSNAYIATVMGITINDATPIFVEPNQTYNMDSQKIEEKITDQTKAILVTHLYGQATEMKTIKKICQKHHLFLLEDCAQSHFAKYDYQYTGTIGNIGFFSFYPTKNLGAFGDGGAIVTDSQKIADDIKTLRNYGSNQKYHHEVVGINSRLDEIQAGLLSVKLKHYQEIVNERQEIAEIYLNEINNTEIVLPVYPDKESNVWHQFVVRVKNRDEFQEYLKKNGIKTEVHYPIPPHLSEAYQYLGYHVGDFPIAEAYAKSVVSLPIYDGLKIEKVKYIVEKINQYTRRLV